MIQYFTQGIAHITDLDGYDHMLFLMVLSAPFTIKQWKTLILLATAFTIGHSISLVMASLELITFSSHLIEKLIPVTIMITGIANLVRYKTDSGKINWMNYLATCLFGVIHGMGFSSFFRMISDDTAAMIKNLIMFNLGVEFGQLLIISIFLILSSAILYFKLLSNRRLTIALSIIGILLSGYLFTEKLFAG